MNVRLSPPVHYCSTRPRLCAVRPRPAIGVRTVLSCPATSTFAIWARQPPTLTRVTIERQAAQRAARVRLARVVGIAAALALVYWLLRGSSSGDVSLAFTRHDLGAAVATPRRGRLLVLTPVKNAEPHLEAYFEALERIEYPKRQITIAFLVSDSTDRTEAKIRRYADRARSRGGEAAYAGIRMLRRDFGFALPGPLRHAYETQPMRRSMLARARNHLLMGALEPDISWVLWLGQCRCADMF